MHPLLVIGRQGCRGLRLISPRTGTHLLQRKSHTHGYAPGHHNNVAAIVVGGGPAGIAAVGNLLTSIKPEEGKIAWVDRDFDGGLINKKYREVPSNTKAELFSQFAVALKPFEEICDAALKPERKPNALTELRQLPQDKTCSLHYAGNMLKLLTDGLAMHDRVSAHPGGVGTMTWDKSTSRWSLTIKVDELKAKAYETDFITRSAPLVVLCTGASPKFTRLPVDGSRNLYLDIALTPTALARELPRELEKDEGPLKEGRPITVGVIGASHSAILVLKNLWDLHSKSKLDSPLKNIRVKWFTRYTNLKYAIYEKDYIIYDNTGLKGTSAKFARRHLEGDSINTSGVGKIIKRVDCSGGEEAEKEQFEKELPGCDFVVQAIGYEPVPLPIIKNGPEVLKFDDTTGGFRDGHGKEVRGLFGAGIAFPERVTDPLGNVESAVGMWKFMKFLKRVVPAWVEKTRKDQGGSLAAKTEI
ncbi:Pyridine nucleotide-disulfide oxidoreductase domain containing protein [Rhypophila decipiens]